MEKLQWSAPEYDERERSSDWFWALGVIVVAGGAASVIYENYFFAALIILSGVMLGFFANRKPEMVTYELNQRGLKIRGRLYPYENIKSFWVQSNNNEDAEENKEKVTPTLFVKSERVFIPIFSIPIADDMAEDIRSIMTSKNVAEEEMKEHPSEKIIESLGF